MWNGSKGDAVVNREQLAGTLKVTAHQWWECEVLQLCWLVVLGVASLHGNQLHIVCVIYVLICIHVYTYICLYTSLYTSLYGNHLHIVVIQQLTSCRGTCQMGVSDVKFFLIGCCISCGQQMDVCTKS